MDIGAPDSIGIDSLLSKGNRTVTSGSPAASLGNCADFAELTNRKNGRSHLGSPNLVMVDGRRR